MIISKAPRDAFQEVRAFYHSLIDALEGSPYHPMWQKDIYPAPAELQSALDEQSLYFGRTGDRIAAAMVLNQKCNDAYRAVSWQTDIRQEDCMVIHMLGVHSAFAGKGCAKEMVRYAIDFARSAGLKAVRLDVLKGNIPAERLYENLGFVYADTVPMFYEDTGRTEFKLYEYIL